MVPGRGDDDLVSRILMRTILAIDKGSGQSRRINGNLWRDGDEFDFPPGEGDFFEPSGQRHVDDEFPGCFFAGQFQQADGGEA